MFLLLPFYNLCHLFSNLINIKYNIYAKKDENKLFNVLNKKYIKI